MPNTKPSAKNIRRAERKDAAGISAIIVDTLRTSNTNDYSEDVIERFVQLFSVDNVETMIEERLVLVAEHQGQIIGTASLENSQMRAVFVSPQAQSRGIGTALIRAIEDEAHRENVDTLTVNSSTTAQGFYTRLGYQTIREHLYGDERTIIMERKLFE